MSNELACALRYGSKRFKAKEPVTYPQWSLPLRPTLPNSKMRNRLYIKFLVRTNPYRFAPSYLILNRNAPRKEVVKGSHKWLVKYYGDYESI